MNVKAGGRTFGVNERPDPSTRPKGSPMPGVQVRGDTEEMKKTVVFDFDGVIHSYHSGWRGVTIIPDPPVPGIREAIAEIRKKYKVVVVSSRCYQEGGIQAIRDWLWTNMIPVDNVTGEKPPAIAYIDDRGITFDGHPETLLERIQSFRTWQGSR